MQQEITNLEDLVRNMHKEAIAPLDYPNIYGKHLRDYAIVRGSIIREILDKIESMPAPLPVITNWDECDKITKNGFIYVKFNDIKLGIK